MATPSERAEAAERRMQLRREEADRQYRLKLINELARCFLGRAFDGEFTVSCHNGEFSLSFGIECNHVAVCQLTAEDFAAMAAIIRRAERRSGPADRAASSVSIRPGGSLL